MLDVHSKEVHTEKLNDGGVVGTFSKDFSSAGKWRDDEQRDSETYCISLAVWSHYLHG